LSLYFFFMSLRWYSGLWERAGADLLNRTVYAFIKDEPSRYYFNSFLPSLTLVQHLRRHGSPVVAYDYGGGTSQKVVVPDLRGAAPRCGPDHVLTHLPTSLYDIEYFRDEMRAAGKKLINLQSKYWDLPIDADVQIGLADVGTAMEQLAPREQQRVIAFSGALTAKLNVLMTPHMDLPNYRARQVEDIVQQYRAQLVAYFGLQRYFKESAPAKVIMSGHDTGFHGPLVAFAKQMSLPVIVLPHSKTNPDIDFAYDNLVVLTHPMQGRPIHDVGGKPVAHFPVSFPERFSGSSAVGRGLRSLSLMLNSLTLGGIPFAPPDEFLDGIGRIVKWCRANDVAFDIRCKPGCCFFSLLSACVGVDANVLARNVSVSMDEHLRGRDLCLMYDFPTSGSIHALRNSIPILNPVVSELANHQLALVHPDLIVPESVDATLQRMDGFRADPLSLYRFRSEQFHAYLSLFRSARPLRTHL
jgi:hypothetical protein